MTKAVYDELSSAGGRTATERIGRGLYAPLRLIDGCIVKRRLTGPDLWKPLAKEEGATPRVENAIIHGIVLTAQLHRLDPAAVPDLAVHAYARDPYLPAPESCTTAWAGGRGRSSSVASTCATQTGPP